MIKPTQPIVSWGVAGAAALGYGLLFAEPGTLKKAASLILGLSAVACSAVAWSSLEKTATRNPELMNAHFITQGALSAVDGDPDEIQLARGIFYRAGGRPRGSRIR